MLLFLVTLAALVQYVAVTELVTIFSFGVKVKMLLLTHIVLVLTQ